VGSASRAGRQPVIERRLSTALFAGCVGLLGCGGEPRTSSRTPTWAPGASRWTPRRAAGPPSSALAPPASVTPTGLGFPTDATAPVRDWMNDQVEDVFVQLFGNDGGCDKPNESSKRLRGGPRGSRVHESAASVRQAPPRHLSWAFLPHARRGPAPYAVGVHCDSQPAFTFRHRVAVSLPAPCHQMGAFP
jgi:hypothetical protein